MKLSSNFILNNNNKVYLVRPEVDIRLFMMSHSLFSTLINLLGDAVAFVKQAASCVLLVHQFTELISLFSSFSLMMHTSIFSLFSFNVFVECIESNNNLLSV